jgi:integrase
MNPTWPLGQTENSGQLGSEMSNTAPHLRLLPLDAEVQEPAPKKKLPPGFYRPTYACKKCKRCKAKNTCKDKREQNVIWFRKSIRGVRYYESTGCTDLRNAKEVAARMMNDWERQSVGLPKRERMTLKTAKTKFRKYLKTQKGTDEYIDVQMGYLDEVLVAGAVRFVNELEEDVFADWLPLAEKKKLRARGKNVRLYVSKRFGGWLMKKGHVQVDPFALLTPFNEKKDRAHVRRAMWPGECEGFLRSVRMRQIIRARAYRVNAGLTKEAMIKLRREGRVRALVYNTVSQTGLRRKETRLLLIKNVDFENGVIWLPQDVAKSGHEQYVRLNSDLARRLKAYLRTLDGDPETLLFPSTRSWVGERSPKSAIPTIKTFNKDLVAAGLPKKDARDRVLDFHALRMTYITHLRLAGVSLDMAKRLARHSDVRLTEDIYTDFELMAGPEREAAEMLVPERRRQRFVPGVR